MGVVDLFGFDFPGESECFEGGAEAFEAFVFGCLPVVDDAGDVVFKGSGKGFADGGGFVGAFWVSSEAGDVDDVANVGVVFVNTGERKGE